jgi:hypothetical protein
MRKAPLVLGVIFIALIIIAVVFFGFTFLNALKMLPAVEKFVDIFYQHYNNQDYGFLYNVIADQAFRDVTSAGKFSDVMRGLQQKLGAVQSRQKDKWNLKYSTDGIFFHIQYKTTHTKAAAAERFILKNNKGKWSLYNYNIRADSL